MSTSVRGATGEGVEAELARRIQAAWTTIADQRDALLAWHAAAGPAAALTDPDAEWDPGRVLAHLAEMVRYWHGEMERILAGGREPITIGRFGTDSVRVLTVERDRDLPVDELLARVDVDVRRVVARLTTLDDSALSTRALHRYYSDRGEMTLADIVTTSLAKHLEDHSVQLDRALRLAGAAGGRPA